MNILDTYDIKAELFGLAYSAQGAYLEYTEDEQGKILELLVNNCLEKIHHKLIEKGKIKIVINTKEQNLKRLQTLIKKGGQY